MHASKDLAGRSGRQGSGARDQGPEACACLTGPHALLELASRQGAEYTGVDPESAARGAKMAQSLFIEVDLPRDWKHFSMPAALNDRLQELLDKQDETGKLSSKERREAEALVKLAEVFSLMKVRAA
jgi:hypothetical protein